MDDSETRSLEQVRAFLDGSGEMQFAGERREEVYGWIERTLVRHEYGSLSRPSKELVVHSADDRQEPGASDAADRELVTQYERVKFPARYTESDVNLLAYVDKAHGNLSGPATKRILDQRSA